MTYVHKNGIECGHDLFYSPVVDISYGEVVFVPLFACNFLQPVILRQSNGNLLRLYVHNQFAFHT